MKKYHEVKELIFSTDKMEIKIDGNKYSFNISEISERLKSAGKLERENFRISPSGYGIRWPSIDEDLSIDGLLGIKHKQVVTKRKLAS